MATIDEGDKMSSAPLTLTVAKNDDIQMSEMLVLTGDGDGRG